jgi:uncharacterized membrane protein YkvA (DUF1232 family)
MNAQDDHRKKVPSESQRRDFYQKLRARVSEWAAGKDLKTNKAASFVLAAPDLFHLCCKLLTDPRTPAKSKITLGAVIAYFISPIDLMPEAVFGPLGFVDDVAFAALAIDKLVDSVGEEVIQEHWAGEADGLQLVRSIVATMDEQLGKRVASKLRKLIKS